MSSSTKMQLYSETVKKIQALLAEKLPEGLVVPEHTETAHFYRHVPSGGKFASVTTKTGILDSPNLKMWAASQAAQYIEQNLQALIDGSAVQRADIYKAATLYHNDQFKEAGDIGTKGHKVIEDYLLKWIETGIQPEDIATFITYTDHRIYAIARSAEKFCHDFYILPIASELRIASLKYRYAGTLDSLMMVARILKKGDGSCSPQPKWITHDWMQTTSGKYICRKCAEKIAYDFCIVDWKSSNSIDKPEYAMQVSAYRNALVELTGLRPQKMYVVRLDKAVAKYEVRIVKHRTEAFKAFVSLSKTFDWLENKEDQLPLLNQRTRILLKSVT